MEQKDSAPKRAAAWRQSSSQPFVALAFEGDCVKHRSARINQDRCRWFCHDILPACPKPAFLLSLPWVPDPNIAAQTRRCPRGGDSRTGRRGLVVVESWFLVRSAVKQVVVVKSRRCIRVSALALSLNRFPGDATRRLQSPTSSPTDQLMKAFALEICQSSHCGRLLQCCDGPIIALVSFAIYHGGIDGGGRGPTLIPTGYGIRRASSIEWVQNVHI